MVQRLIAIPGMLLFGTGSTIISKFLYEQKSMGLDGYEKPFEKPWFQTLMMFLGMTLSLVVFGVEKLIKKMKNRSDIDSESSNDQEEEGEKVDNEKNWKVYLYIAAPACCDLVASTLMNIGLLYIQASVWQMLRGAMVLFSSIFSAFILKRKTYPYMWFSVFLIIIALAVVGFSAVTSTGVGVNGVSKGNVVLAIFLVIGSQVIQAGQIIIEDFLMHDITAAPTFVVGVEGLWGSLLTSAVFLPVMQHIPGEEGMGLHEDTLDTFEMIRNNKLIMGFVIFKVLVVLLFNITGMMTTKVTTGVIRTILEGMRTLCTWIVSLIMYYAMVGTDYHNAHPNIGEKWTDSSWIQLAGFAILFVGMLLYNAIIKIPCIFNYPEEVVKKEEEKKDLETFDQA